MFIQSYIFFFNIDGDIKDFLKIKVHPYFKKEEGWEGLKKRPRHRGIENSGHRLERKQNMWRDTNE